MQEGAYPQLAHVGDAATLECLDDETLLEWLTQRHKNNLPYGYIGDSLVAVNPCQQLDIYDADYHDKYTELRVRGSEDPHIFWVADQAYQNLRDTGEDQCVVVSGDSGAGKTESTKYILGHMVRREKHKTDLGLVDRLERVNPLLELFGNAATVLNANSSRFGKLVELEYDPDCKLRAAKIECFILEKFRVTSRNSQEKNFHAFYAVFAGMSPQCLADLELEADAEFYRILRCEDGVRGVFSSVEDKRRYRNFFNDMGNLLTDVGFSADEVDMLFKVLAAILLIGNIEFDPDEIGNAEITEWSEDTLVRAAGLMGLPLDEDGQCSDLAFALTTIKTLAGGEVMVRRKTVRQANDGRDAVARELYSSLFYGIIDKVNQKLSGSVQQHQQHHQQHQQQHTSYHTEGKGNCIRILDISGFENVAHNSFEQLLINAANERLHAFFLNHTFRMEREEYDIEEVDLLQVDFHDNEAILDLIFKKPHGVFPLMDDQLSIPNSSDDSFLQATNKYNARHVNYVTTPSRSHELTFGIKHYAGQVMYNSEGFLEKNSDTLHNNLVKVIEESDNIFVRDYFLLGSRTSFTNIRGGRSSLRLRRGSRAAIPTAFVNERSDRSTGQLTGRVTTQFKTSLDHMMSKLNTAKPIFVRCIKPNLDLKPRKFDSRLVREQLQSSGLLQVATVRKAGFPIRVSYHDFANRYAILTDGLHVDRDARTRTSLIMSEAGIREHQMGKTKVFLKMHHKDRLEELIARRKVEAEKAERERRLSEQKARQEAKRRSPSVDSITSIILDDSEISESGIGTRSPSQEDLTTIEEEKEEGKEEEEGDQMKSASSEDNLKDIPSFLAFRMTERDFEHSNEFEMKIRRACRFFMYILLMLLVLVSGTASVVSLSWITRSISQSLQVEDKTFSVTMAMLCQLMLVVFMWISCLIKSCFGRKEWPTICTISVICIMDLVQCAGRSLFLYRVLPVLTPLEGVIVGLAVFQLPTVMKISTSIFKKKKKKRKCYKFCVKLLLNLFALLVQFGTIPALLFRGIFLADLKHAFDFQSISDYWPMVVFPILVTSGWWENYFYGVLKCGPCTAHAGRRRKNIQRVRETSYIYSGLLQIPVITILPHLLIDEHMDMFSVIGTMFTHYRVMWNPIHRLGFHFAQFGLLYINVASTLVCSYSSGIACRLFMQRVAFALPIVLIPMTAGAFLTLCVPNNIFEFWTDGNFCTHKFPLTTDSYFVLAVGVLAWISYVIITVHIWKPDLERMANLDRLFVFNHRDSIFPYQTLAVKRRQDGAHKKDRHHKEKVDKEVDDKALVYICATMWHETRQEMLQLLKSLFRLDFDTCARRIAAMKFPESKIDNYDAEVHIIFDDAFETDKQSGQRVVNAYVRQLLEVLPHAVTSVAKGRMELQPCQKIITPYGGRLAFEMPGGTLFNVHLKDKDKIRHKKRWSQIMYLYYLLGFKLVAEDYETVEDLIEDNIKGPGDAKAKAKKRLKRPRVRPFTSLLNNMPDDVIHKAENVFILALDGDVDFRPDAVRLLIDRMKKNKKVGAVCGRIHPIGDGPMVWYQKFEYSVGHWMQKAAEHVFGCVLCCPGCFSLFRGTALMDDNVMRMYATEPTEARHYVQYEQGEDRWLCTLLLQQGWKIDYCAGSDAFTYAPETFNEFYIQRRRWSPSTMANIMDLLGSWRTTVKMNDNISTLFMMYQFFLLISSIIAPGTVVFMIAGSYNAVLQVDMWTGYLMSVLPVLAFILLCLKAKTSTQIKVAAIMSALYAIVMMIVTVGMLINIVEEDFFTPNVLFLVGLSIIFVITGIVHPKETMNLFHGILYFLTVPSTFVFLTVFFLCNLNVVSWGTREGPKKPDSEVDPLEQVEAKDGKVAKFLKGLGISAIIRDIRTFMLQLVGNSNRDQRSTPLVGLTPQDSLTNLHRIEVARPDRPAKKERQKRVVLDHSHWAKELDIINSREPSYLEDKEQKFWNVVIHEYLLPLKSNQEQQDKIKNDLLSARNNVVFAYFLLNLMFTLVILQLQLKQDILKETFFIVGKYEPVSVVFLSSFTLLLLIQFTGSVTHQWGTFLHLIASSKITWFKGNRDEQKSLDAIREAQKLQSAYGLADELLPDYDDDDDDDDSMTTRPSSDRMEMIEEYPDYDDEDEAVGHHMSQYERNFQRNFRTVRRHFDRNPRYRPSVPTVSRNARQYDFQRRQELYRSISRNNNDMEQYGHGHERSRRGMFHI